MKHTTTQFDFSAKPKVAAVKPKYRDREEQRLDGTNLMNDPRVVRGNTYAAIIANKNEIQPPAPAKKQIKTEKKFKERRINFDTGFEPATPRPIDGRDHFTTQTEPFVETLRDKPIQYQKECQTDLFLDRPVERLFNPMDGKIGHDRSTQIEENDPELFNFDYEVQPILDALLSKVIETSRMQLYEQKLLKEKDKEKIEYEKKRHARLVQAQKLEANEDRLKQEYDRRQLQYRKSKQQKGFIEKKVIGRIISKHYQKNLKQNTQTMLQHEGFFRNPLQIDLYERFVPWVYDEIMKNISRNKAFENEVEKIVKEASQDRLKGSSQSILKEKNRKMGVIEQKRRKREDRISKREQEKLAKQAEQREKEKQEEVKKQEQGGNQGE